MDLDFAESICLNASTASISMLVWKNVLMRVSAGVLNVWKESSEATEIFFHMESIAILLAVATIAIVLG
jgi:hypothetical protein